MGQTKGRFLLGFTVLFICLQILATVLMITGQSLAYFLSDYVGLHVVFILSFITFMSIGTFLATYKVILRAEKKKPDINFFFYLMFNGLYGFIVSLMAIFVLAMWWG